MHPEDFKLTAYALGELEPAEQTALDEHLRDCAACRQAVDEARAFGQVLVGELEKETCPEPALWPRNVFYPRTSLLDVIRPTRWRWVEVSLVSAAALFLLAGLSGLVWQSRRASSMAQFVRNPRVRHADGQNPATVAAPGYFRYEPNEARRKRCSATRKACAIPVDGQKRPILQGRRHPVHANALRRRFGAIFSRPPTGQQEGGKPRANRSRSERQANGLITAMRFHCHLSSQDATANPLYNSSGTRQWMKDDVQYFPKGAEFHLDAAGKASAGWRPRTAQQRVDSPNLWSPHTRGPIFELNPGAASETAPNTEAYSQIIDNPFREVHDHPLSTFSIDVDTASYSNLRRFLTTGARPPKDAVRIEELLNYFAYDYSPPQNDAPFASHVEVAECPWNLDHRLVRIALKGREINAQQRPVSNLVFLLDVSGSMQPANKLPLVKQAMQLLVQKLGENDRVAIVVYQGASGLVLPSTTCDQKESILASLERLQSGGSTAGGAGIELAYDVAQKNFILGGTNRVILCTDGDFNVGITDPESLKSLIKAKAADGVFLSVLGFGMGNLKNDRLEMLADKGNGNYAYIDNEKEAKKVLVEQMSGTLVTIAKDVKIQVEFNPEKVGAYRLIGYENRLLKAQDFNDDKKDAGEIGAGHTVTALYEIVPAGHAIGPAAVDPLKYQKQPAQPVAAVAAGDASRELLTLKLRYKEPDGQTSRLLEYPITDSNHRFAESSKDFRFRGLRGRVRHAVAGFAAQGQRHARQRAGTGPGRTRVRPRRLSGRVHQPGQPGQAVAAVGRRTCDPHTSRRSGTPCLTFLFDRLADVSFVGQGLP